MQLNRAIVFSRLSFCAALAVISFLATTGRQFPIVEAVSDKINHLLAFYVLALLADFSWPASGFRPAKFLPLIGYGLVIEAVQRYLPYREFSLLDLAADSAGLLLYAASIPLLRKVRPLSVRFMSPSHGPQVDDRS